MLSEAERLELHQLRLLDRAERKTAAATDDPEVGNDEDNERRHRSLAHGWSLMGDIELRPWQLEAVDDGKLVTRTTAYRRSGNII